MLENNKDALDLKRQMNGAYIDEMNINDFKDAEKSKYLCKAIKRFFPFTGTDMDLILMYYTNEFMLQDKIRLELKKHIFRHIDTISERCIKYGNLKVPINKIKFSIFNYFKAYESSGLFNPEFAWFLSSEDCGGILDSNPISEIVSYIEE